MAKYDVIVIGLGAMGSAALAELAERGARVLGIEQFALGHDQGSSHGNTRIIRLGYFEHPSYVPLLHRTYELWRKLEAKSGRKLMHITGIAEMGAPDSSVVAGTLAASRMHKLRHEVMTAAETMARFPAFRLPSHYVGVFQPDGGFLAVEDALETHIALAKAAGAEVRSGAAVRSVGQTAAGVRVETSEGSFEADQVIVSAGAWATKAAPVTPPIPEEKMWDNIAYFLKAAIPAVQLVSGGRLISTGTWRPRVESASSARVRTLPRHSSTSCGPSNSAVDLRSSRVKAALKPPSSVICCSRWRSTAENSRC